MPEKPTDQKESERLKELQQRATELKEQLRVAEMAHQKLVHASKLLLGELEHLLAEKKPNE